MALSVIASADIPHTKPTIIHAITGRVGRIEHNIIGV